MKSRLSISLLLFFVLIFSVNAQSSLTLTPIGTYTTGLFDEGAQEIGSYDPASKRFFVTNAEANVIDILDLSDPSNPSLVSQISLDEYGAGINSVAVGNGFVAAAVEGAETGVLGKIVFLNTDGTILNSVDAGYLPDMVLVSHDGNYVLTANEGEPNADYSIDPEGSVTIVNISGGIENLSPENIVQVSFTAFNTDGERAAELPAEVRIFGPNATVAQDLEPEYISVSPDNSTAFVTLQENNAVAVIDIATGTINSIIALGYKDYSLEANAFDASDEDGGINFVNAPVFGMYLPDAIASVEQDGLVYFLTANEGDARDYETFAEESRIGDETIAAALGDLSVLARLKLTTTQGDTDGDGDYDAIYSYGARSFSIWTSAGELVFDSGSDFERIIADLSPETFNSNGTSADFDSRSDDKGPEPEGITIGTIGENTYAFIILERASGIMVYDISNPTTPSFVTYANNAIVTGNAEEGTAGDIGPEASVFIPAELSPNGQALLVVTNEVSGSTTIYQINQ